MKKKLLFLIVMIAFVAISADISLGQYYYYYPDGSVKNLDTYDTLLAIGFKNYMQPEAGMYAQVRPYLQDNFEFREMPGGFIVFGVESGYSLEYVMQQVRAETGVYMVNPVIIGVDSTPIYATNQVAAYFNNDIAQTQIDSLNDIFNLSTIQTVGTDSIYYFFEFTDSTEGTIFDICNAYFETGMARYIYPNFVYRFNPEAEPNDSYFDYQWHLHNTGQSGGTSDADIDMPEAWDMNPEMSAFVLLRNYAVA